MSNTHSFTHSLAALLRVGLVLGLVLAVWGVYRRLPRDNRAVFGSHEQPSATTLRIRLDRSEMQVPVAAGKIPVQLYPINMAAARNEFDSERRPGVRFEEFATRLMGDRQPVTAEIDERGEAVVAVPPGRWWVHATLSGQQEITWRLSVNVAGREKTVELTPENAYARAKRF